MTAGAHAAAHDGPGGEDIAGAVARYCDDAEQAVMAWLAHDPMDRAIRGCVCRSEWWLTLFDLGDVVARGYGTTHAAAMRDLGRELWMKTRGGA